MPSPAIIVIQKLQPQLEKAKLLAYNKEAPDIELMFNPTDISFARTVRWKNDDGNRGTTLLPKINFSAIEPYTFILKQLLYDTYETKESVMKKYIDNIKKGVEGITKIPDSRPPVYIFTWKTEYFYCVITSLTYTLNMFLSDGTPVRALVDIALQEVDQKNLPGGTQSLSKAEARGRQPSNSLGNTGKQNSQNQPSSQKRSNSRKR
ncbi:CIS tube protein [Nostoc sp.]|uniref:CIS tube protein n=1 Tax=Nostoc sp. TaxID=1180 RepID=UPI002FFAFE2A